MDPTILAIESSCDDTAVAVMHGHEVKHHVVVTQDIHTKYAGVVPELASRSHENNMLPAVERTLKASGVTLKGLDAIAFTRGPGLLGGLMVGTMFAKSLAFALGIPLIAVNHLQAHVLANFIDAPRPSFPFVCLIVSGGHTQLVLAKNYLDMTLLGETRDDAMGEAFDKMAKVMGLPYPGGPLIDQYSALGSPEKFTFPATHVSGLDFSFSGIKTAFQRFVAKRQAQDPNFLATYRHDLCASIQANLVHMVLEKIGQAMEQTGVKCIALAGGVAANSALRGGLANLAGQKGWTFYVPEHTYCTDNGVMIGMAAYYQFLAKDFCGLDIVPRARIAW